MKEFVVTNVISNKAIAKDIYDMTIALPTDITGLKPGQFAQLFVPKGEHILPRPISVCEADKEKNEMRLVYQVSGKGTECFSKMQLGDELKILSPLGNGFDIEKEKKNIGIVGGGIGIPPMLELTKEILKTIPDADITVFLGFRADVYLLKDFAKLGVKVKVATDNGNIGFKGNVIQLMESLDFKADVVYACGPKIMLKFLSKWAEQKEVLCYVSMEERMACGIGACVGCAVLAKSDGDKEATYKKVCKDGPVFKSTEVIWDE